MTTMLAPTRLPLRKIAVLTVLLIAARLLFILLMPAVYSNDLHAWLRVMDLLDAGQNPYRETGVLNWPPFWMQILFALRKISDKTGINPTHLVQSALIGSEVLTLWALAWIAPRFASPGRWFRILLFGLALNPLCIFLSCQHCNYDVFVGLIALLAVACLTRFADERRADDWLMACFFVGLGILAKTIPVMLSPLLLAGWRSLSWRQRFSGGLLLAAPFSIGMSVLFSLEQQGVKDHVINYRSMGGWYGFSGLIHQLISVEALDAFHKLSPVLFVMALIGASWYCIRYAPGSRQILQCATLLLFFIPMFGPGYSPPYLLWFLPLLLLQLASADRSLLRLSVLAWGVVNLTYLAEYAVLESHGAFLTRFITRPDFLQWVAGYGGKWDQTLLRLPMFACYLTLFGMLAQRFRTPRVKTV